MPKTNIVGVNVSVSEKISRDSFEKDLIPKVKSAVLSKKKTGVHPSILLVYGIPLTIKAASLNKNNFKIKKIAQSKVKEYLDLIFLLTKQLNNLIQEDQIKPVSRDNFKLKNIDPTLKKTLLAARQYLKTHSSLPNDKIKNEKIGSILFRLLGTSPVSMEIIKRFSMPSKENLFILRFDNLLKWNKILTRQLNGLKFTGVMPKDAESIATLIRLVNGIMGELKFWDDLQKNNLKEMTLASVDSELTMLLQKPYLLTKWLPNPYLNEFDKYPDIENIREKTLKVARLDAPTPAIAKRLVDDAIATEKIGLKGNFYIDARGLKGEEKWGQYPWYDGHLRKLYNIIKEKSNMKVILDNNNTLFPKGSGLNTALYVGWYSLGNYVDSFKWQKGSVGFHVASLEAKTLKQPYSRVWCKRMLEEGVAATLGPVKEPFLSSFPLPDLFFPLLMTGKLSLLDVYFRTIPSLSWRQVLIGDPLYNPFKNKPAIDPSEIIGIN